ETQQLGNFFLHVDDDSRLGQLISQTLVFPFQLGQSQLRRMRLGGLGTGFLVFQRGKGSSVPGCTPFPQRRVVDPFATQQGSQFTMLACIGGLQNAQLLLGREPTPLWLSHHFWIRSRLVLRLRLQLVPLSRVIQYPVSFPSTR